MANSKTLGNTSCFRQRGLLGEDATSGDLPITAMEAALHARSLLAAGLLQPLSENLHPGHQLSTVALYSGIGFVNSNTATGLRVCLYDDGRRSRDTGKERDSESGLDYFGASDDD